MLKVLNALFNLQGIDKMYLRRLRIFGGLAQLGERLPCKQEVSGSIPLISTNLKNRKRLTEVPWKQETSLNFLKEIHVHLEN